MILVPITKFAWHGGGEVFMVNQPFPKRQILDSSKFKEFADDNY